MENHIPNFEVNSMPQPEVNPTPQPSNSLTKDTTVQSFKFPTEMVDLPSQGLLYPEGHPLASGKIEMKYMTAKEEDILTNQNYISQGIVLDKLLQSLIITKVNYDDIFIGDKNAILIASRILGYGKDYTFEYGGEEHTIDLTSIENKTLNLELFTKGKNEFTFTLPASQVEVTFQLINGALEKRIEQELKGLKKLNKNNSPELTTRLKHIIIAVNGDSSPKTIREFIENYMLARDSKALRDYIRDIQPDIDMNVEIEVEGVTEVISLPMGASFFFPDAE